MSAGSLQRGLLGDMQCGMIETVTRVERRLKENKYVIALYEIYKEKSTVLRCIDILYYKH